MRCTTAEMEIHFVAGKRDRIVDAGEGGGMPGDGDVDIVEDPGPHHEALRGPAFLGRAAIIANPPLEAVRGKVVLDCGRGQHRTGAEQVMSATMSIAAGCDR